MRGRLAFLYLTVLWLACVFLMLVGPQAAHASIPPVNQGQECNASYGCGPFSTPDSAGAGASCSGAPHPAGFTMSFTWNGGSPVLCYWQNTSGGSIAYTWTVASSCPANSTGTTSCTCKSGFYQNGTNTACVTHDASICSSLNLFDASTFGQTYSFQLPGKSNRPASLCDTGVAGISAGNGCTIPVDQDVSISFQDKTGAWVTQVTGLNHDGTTCAGAVAPAPVPTNVACTGGQVGMVLNGVSTCQPPGKCPGSINGLDVAVNCNNSVSTTTTKSTDSETPAGGGTPVNTTSSTGVTVDCSAGPDACVKTTTTTKSDGSVSSTTQSGNKDSVCAGTSGQAACVGSASGGGGGGSDSSFGGSCAAGFKCEGDAVQCAMAQEQYTRNCQNSQVDSTTQATFTALTAQAGTTATATTAGDTSFSLSSYLPSPPASSCSLSDTTVTIGPMAVPFPLGTVLCPKLYMIRSVVVGFGLLMWGLIVMGTKR